MDYSFANHITCHMVLVMKVSNVVNGVFGCSFGTSTLSFNYSNGSSGDVKCEVFFTIGEGLQRVEGRPASSPSDAKRIACLDACKHLYECGMLTDRLIPKNYEDEHPLVNAAQGNNHVPGTRFLFYV